MVFQSYAPYPYLTVRENMSFGLRISEEYDNQIERRVEETAELLEVSEFLFSLQEQPISGQ